MTIKPVHWIVLGLALSLGAAVCGFHVRDRYSVAVGRYEEALKIAKADDAIKDKELKEQAVIIAEQDKVIAGILADAEKPSASDIEKDKAIAELVQKLHQLEISGDTIAQVDNLKAQVKAWAEKFSLAETRHSQGLFDLNAAWQVKFDAQVVISNVWKAKYESEAYLRSLAEKNWKTAETKLKWARTVSNVEKLIILGVGGKVIYDALQGK